VLPERYANVERIGTGGMGEIVRAEDTALGRTVAVKLLADRFAADENVRARFTREALAAARVSSQPNTVTTFDVGEWEGRPYIVMEYLPGGSVAERLEREGAQPPAKALAWLEGAARAIDAAHRVGVVHRDVKPANLLLDDEDAVKVADFGIASAAGTTSLTQAGTVLGTAGYLSPEQARGEQATSASDRYALGVVAYELLTGHRPFERDSPTAEAAAHAHEEPPRASAAGAGLPPAVDGVFTRALAKDPRERPATGGELVADLRSALREDAAPTRILATPTAETAVREPEPRRRRSLLPLGLGLLALLAVAGIGLAAALASGDDPEVLERTVERTVTTQGRTVTVTTTTEQAATTEATTESEQPAAASDDPAALNDQGFSLMQAGNYQAALPLLERAVELSQGSGSLTEAYASYNLAYTRFQLGNCDGVLELLDRSQQVQGHRDEIDELRSTAAEQCAGEENGGEGQGGKSKGKAKGRRD
jgi:eukaryotic-like serine/threonine-protein kinase